MEVSDKFTVVYAASVKYFSANMQKSRNHWPFGLCSIRGIIYVLTVPMRTVELAYIINHGKVTVVPASWHACREVLLIDAQFLDYNTFAYWACAYVT